MFVSVKVGLSDNLKHRFIVKRFYFECYMILL